jgi:hypothetical protein
MFKKHKLEIRLKKDGVESEVDQTPKITKEDVIHVTKKVLRHAVGGILIVLAGAAVIDTAKFGAMTAIDNKSNKEED